MFRSFLCKSGRNLKRATSIIDRESSSSSLALSAKYFRFTTQNQFDLNKSRVTFICYFFSTSNLTSSDSSSPNSFVVSYLINSCGLPENEAIVASEKLNFKTTTKPDSVLTLLKTYGITQPHISKLITKHPSVLSANPHETLKPKLDFFKSRGICENDLAYFITRFPRFLRQSLNERIVPVFDILKSIVHTDENVNKLITRVTWVLSVYLLKRIMVNLDLLRSEGVPETNISKYLVRQARVFIGDADRFRKIVEKTKEKGFNPLNMTFLVAIHVLASMTEVNWRKKKDVYKRWGWSEDQIQSAFRKNPWCMTASEKKITALMSFLVNEMGYDSSSAAEYPLITSCSLKWRIIPRCSVIKILVSKGLIKELIPLSALSKMLDEAFLERFVKMYEKEVPELMNVFQGHLNYQDLLQN